VRKKGVHQGRSAWGENEVSKSEGRERLTKNAEKGAGFRWKNHCDGKRGLSGVGTERGEKATGWAEKKTFRQFRMEKITIVTVSELQKAMVASNHSSNSSVHLETTEMKEKEGKYRKAKVCLL